MDFAATREAEPAELQESLLIRRLKALRDAGLAGTRVETATRQRQVLDFLAEHELWKDLGIW